jgi:hypothetical protein
MNPAVATAAKTSDLFIFSVLLLFNWIILPQLLERFRQRLPLHRAIGVTRILREPDEPFHLQVRYHIYLWPSSSHTRMQTESGCSSRHYLKHLVLFFKEARSHYANASQGKAWCSVSPVLSEAGHQQA